MAQTETFSGAWHDLLILALQIRMNPGTALVPRLTLLSVSKSNTHTVESFPLFFLMRLHNA